MSSDVFFKTQQAYAIEPNEHHFQADDTTLREMPGSISDAIRPRGYFSQKASSVVSRGLVAKRLTELAIGVEVADVLFDHPNRQISLVRMSANQSLAVRLLFPLERLVSVFTLDVDSLDSQHALLA